MGKTFEGNRQDYLKRLSQMCLMDDTLMSVVFRDYACTQLLLRIVMENETLIVTNVLTQNSLQNLHGRSVRFDVTAHDSEGKVYNIEVQRTDKGAIPKRARYNSSMLDSNITVSGEKYNDLPESYVIFITENDVLGYGYALYHIERVIQETGTLFDDKAHIIYVNGEYRGNDAIGMLMHDFSCKDANDMNYPLLAKETKRYKESTEGVGVMCRLMEELALENRTKGRIDTIIEFMNAMGLSIEQVMDILKIPAENRDAYREMVNARLVE